MLSKSPVFQITFNCMYFISENNVSKNHFPLFNVIFNIPVWTVFKVIFPFACHSFWKNPSSVQNYTKFVHTAAVFFLQVILTQNNRGGQFRSLKGTFN